MTAILEPQTTAPGAVRDAAPSAPGMPVRVAPAPLPPAAATAVTTAPAGRRPSRARVLLTAKPVLPPTGVRLMGLALVALFWAALELEPAADGTNPTVTGWIAVLGTVQTIALLAGVAGFAMGRRWALWAGVAFSGIGAVNIAMCPASGHHVISGWWYGQVAIGAVMLLLPALGLTRTRPGRR